jgi:hypothetical protein
MNTIKILVLLFGISTLSFAGQSSCGELPPTLNLSNFKYVSKQSAGNYEVSVEFPNLMSIPCLSASITGENFYVFKIENPADMPMLTVKRITDGAITQSLPISLVRIVQAANFSESYVKVFSGMTDLDILSLYPAQKFVIENAERGGSQTKIPATVLLH